MQTFLTRAIPSAKFPQQRFPRLWALMSEQRILRYFHLHCQTKSSEKSEKKKIKKNCMLSLAFCFGTPLSGIFSRCTPNVIHLAALRIRRVGQQRLVETAFRLWAARPPA